MDKKIIKPEYEVTNGIVQMPEEEYMRWRTALVNIAVTGILDKNYAPEVYETFENCVRAARWGLGWETS